MRKAYSPQRKSEVIALARVQGIEATARQTGIDKRAIRGWCERAGVVPADALGTVADWASLGELARSQVAERLASGKVHPRDAAIIAGIADRNTRKPEPQPEPEGDPEAEAWTDALLVALEARYPSVDPIDSLGYAMTWLDGAGEEPWIDDPAQLVARLPADWSAWLADRDAARAAEAAAHGARHERSRTAWPAFYAGRITAEERDAWIRGDIASPIAAQERAEVDAVLAAAEAYLKGSAA